MVGLWIFAIASLVFLCTQPVPRALHRFFLAELVAVLCDASVLAFRPEYSPLYVVVFVFTELLICAAAFNLCVTIVWMWGKRAYEHRWAAMFLGLIAGMLFGIAIFCRHKTWLYDWIALVEGSFYLFMAIPTGMAAAHLGGRQRRVAVGLFALWMFEWVWEHGFTLHLWNPEWMRLNDWLPLLVCSLASLYLGWAWTRKGVQSA